MIEGLLQFLNDSPVNFLAVDSIARRLVSESSEDLKVLGRPALGYRER